MARKGEKRKHPRIEIKWPIRIFAGHGTLEGETRNITPEGVLICCEEPLLLDETYLMSILPPNSEAIGVSGKVVWSDFYGMCGTDTPVCIGICLVKMPEKDRHLLEKLSPTHSH